MMKKFTIDDMISTGMDKDAIMKTLECMVDEKMKPKENPNRADVIAILKHLDAIAIRNGAIGKPIDWDNDPSTDLMVEMIEGIAMDMAKSVEKDKKEKKIKAIPDMSDEEALEDFLSFLDFFFSSALFSTFTSIPASATSGALFSGISI